jgi:coenzyme F420-0:L-glutamate ligase/coenzyme F420-1:gamma-L-glutamate ligase
MGQAAERQPVVVVRGLSFDAPSKPASALVRPRERDMFR